MDDASDALAAALRSLVGVPYEFLLATNSIRIRFDFRRDPRGRAYLWIDPPWRLTAAGVRVTDSNGCPAWGEGGDQGAYRRLWEEWCGHFEVLGRAPLAEACVGWDRPDLCLGFESGHRIETMGEDRRDCWWYYKDRETGEVFEAGPTGIRRAFDGPEAAPGGK